MKRSSLPVPIGEILEERGLEERARVLVERRRARRSRGVRGPIALGLAAAAAAVLAFYAASSRLPSLPPAVGSDARVELGQGSWLATGPGTSLVVLPSAGADVSLLLERGLVELEIAPGTGRRVEIETGLATVLVVGTHYTVERDPRGVRVSVSRGAVVVRGERVPDRVRVVRAGESLEILAEEDDEPEPDIAPAARVEAAVTPVEASIEPRVRVAPVASPRAGERWRALAEHGAVDEAYQDVEEAGGVRVVMERVSPAELLALADVARRSGHPAEAVPPLERLLARCDDDPDCALGAFTLGRVLADSLARPADGARAFERALELPLPPALAPDALARAALAHAAAGEDARARELARRYLDRHPSGARAADVRELVEAR